MPYEFKFPDIGEGLTEGEVVEWKVKPGDKVEDHQILLEVETDKAVAEVPSPKAGYVISTKGEPGEIINVGEVIAVIGTKEEYESGGKSAPKKEARAEKPKAAAKEKKAKPAGKKEEKKEEKKPEPIPAPKPAEPVEVKKGSVGVVGQLEEAPDEDEPETELVISNAMPASKPGSRVLALPHDRALARKMGVDIERVRGTGAQGRVTEDDIVKAAGRGGPEKGAVPVEAKEGTDDYGPVEVIAVKGMRRKIASAMVESLTKSAQVTATDEADVSLLWHIRKKERDAAEEERVKLTFLPFIVKAVIGAMRRDPLMNAAMSEDGSEIVIKNYYNIGIAVETRDGLMVPNVKNADKKSILELAREIEELADRARKRTVDISDLRGGTFTITNYGSIGGIFATPVLNYPEVGILGVGKIMERAIVKNGAIKVARVLPLSLTFDHRVADGATAQHFLNNVVRHLEDPDLILVSL